MKKYITLFFVSLCVFAACKKDSPKPSSSSTPALSKCYPIEEVVDGGVSIMKFEYDASNRIIRFIYDSEIHNLKYTGSSIVDVVGSGSDTIVNIYMLGSNGNIASMAYDRDSTQGRTDYFYDSNGYLIRVLSTFSTYSSHPYKDTTDVNYTIVNGNAVSQSIKRSNAFPQTTNYTFTTLINKFEFTDFNQVIKTFPIKNGIPNKNMVSSEEYNNGFDPPVVINRTYDIDSKGYVSLEHWKRKDTSDQANYTWSYNCK